MLEDLVLEGILLHVLDPLKCDKEKKIKMSNKTKSEQFSLNLHAAI